MVSSAVTAKVKDGDKIIELREDRALFARLLVVSKARQIDLKYNLGKYEFSVVPRALFAPDGSLHHMENKSELMKILESLPKDKSYQETEVIHSASDSLPGNDSLSSTVPDVDTSSEADTYQKVAVVDGMADLQALDKPEYVKTCLQLADHFIERFWEKYETYDEVHLVFDRYDIGDVSLKASTRERRLAGNKAVAYHITDTSSIAKVSMKNLLAHVKTKDEMTTYLAEKILQHAVLHRKNLVVAWRDKADASHKIVNLNSSQEEADTKILLHAVNTANNGASSLRIHCSDTDVLVLAIRRFPQLPPDTCMVTATREIHIGPIYRALGPSKSAALPGFHAFTGADITGKFAGKGKITCWKEFEKLDDNDDIVSAFMQLGSAESPSEATVTALEAFVCRLYVPRTKLTTVADARWWLFKRKQAQAENLPPTKDALIPAIARAHHQALVWYNDVVSLPEIPSPLNYGWSLADGIFSAVMTPAPPAPEAVTQLVKCGCRQTRCANNQCKCKKNGLSCTEFCTCSEEEDPCSNAAPSTEAYTEDSDSSDDENT